MGWTITIGRVAGTEIKVHLTFFILVAFWGMAGYQQAGAAGALAACILLFALFACVVLHEFGHILMAGRFGVRTPDVILLPIGGVARLERIPDEPRQELLIALAGPAVTLAIVLLLYALLALDGSPPRLGELDPDGPFLETLLRVNFYLLVFNLFPAFPMDGGRVLRALLASRLGLASGTRIAARFGQASAVVAGLVGLSTGQPLLALVALFVFLGAGAEAAAVETRVAGEGLNVGQMMVTHFRAIPVHATLADAVDLLLSSEQREFPVVDNTGRVEGMLTRDNLIKGISQRGTTSTVGEAMTAQVQPVSPGLAFQEALDRLRSSGLPALPVVDTGGRLVGLLTLDNITDLLLVKRAKE
ncbi:MAG TPA: site-2 protease family protein [Gemmatimonadales bacterium]|jgi:stage IV sporulation protein FB|nr:site-2 protease family protein [Gemmatimonadales bacterium]